MGLRTIDLALAVGGLDTVIGNLTGPDGTLTNINGMSWDLSTGTYVFEGTLFAQATVSTATFGIAAAFSGTKSSFSFAPVIPLTSSTFFNGYTPNTATSIDASASWSQGFVGMVKFNGTIVVTGDGILQIQARRSAGTGTITVLSTSSAWCARVIQ